MKWDGSWWEGKDPLLWVQVWSLHLSSPAGSLQLQRICWRGLQGREQVLQLLPEVGWCGHVTKPSTLWVSCDRNNFSTSCGEVVMFWSGIVMFGLLWLLTPADEEFVQKILPCFVGLYTLASALVPGSIGTCDVACVFSLISLVVLARSKVLLYESFFVNDCGWCCIQILHTCITYYL